MLRGNKILGVFVIVAVICMMIVFAFEERAYQPNIAKFETIETDTENSVNLNTATLEELCTLAGIGEIISSNIIAFREKTRPFETINDIKLVKGVGDKLFEKNRHRLTTK